jgi:hypothetical protein
MVGQKPSSEGAGSVWGEGVRSTDADGDGDRIGKGARHGSSAVQISGGHKRVALFGSGFQGVPLRTCRKASGAVSAVPVRAGMMGLSRLIG